MFMESELILCCSWAFCGGCILLFCKILSFISTNPFVCRPPPLPRLVVHGDASSLWAEKNASLGKLRFGALSGFHVVVSEGTLPRKDQQSLILSRT